MVAIVATEPSYTLRFRAREGVGQDNTSAVLPANLAEPVCRMCGLTWELLDPLMLETFLIA